MTPALLTLSLLSVARTSARRQLSVSDVAYGLDEFGATYRTRARHLFESEQGFAARLFEHETALADRALQTFLVKLKHGVVPTTQLRASIEERTALVIDTVVGDDLLVHGVTTGVNALRDLPEVQRVVALLPELKISPHFAELLSTHPAEPHAKNATAVRLTLQLIPYDRHAHLREPAARVAEQITLALAEACAAGGEFAKLQTCTTPRAAASGAGKRASSAARGLPPLEAQAESETYLSVRGIARHDAEAVAGLVARRAEVLWVEPVPHFSLRNEFSAQVVQSGSNPGFTQLVGTTPVWDMGIHGEGEIIGVADSGLDTGHCFFEQAQGQNAGQQTYSANSRKVVAYRAYADGEATGTADHGTHVTGSILGESSVAGAAGANEKGVAYKARVSFTDIGEGNSPGLDVPNDLANNMFNVDYANGARLHSNSWGANINAYTTYAAQCDLFMANNEDMVILFAAGNSGGQGPGSVGAPATAKNIITVGASETPNSGAARQDGNMAPFSSQGPTRDLRIKPDVVAPGFFVGSANSNSPGDCPITPMAGTSMATPVTTGAVALVRQYLREGYFPTGVKGGSGPIIPTGALMKALIINSAVDMPGTYQGAALQRIPDNVQGFGRIQLDRIIQAAGVGGKTPGDRMLIVDDTSRPISTASALHEYDIPVSGTPDAVLGNTLKVTLVWTDPPAQPFAANPLLNDLDLIVTTSAGATLRGNDKTGTGDKDGLNNVEQVVTTVPAAGAFKIRVEGAAIREGSQPYALVVTGPLNLIPPPPAPPKPPPPAPPSAPFTGDAIAVGVSVPLLAIALGAGASFIFMRRRSSGNVAKGAGGSSSGWKTMTDPASGMTYYVNLATGTSQWEPPAEMKSAPPPPPPPSQPKPVLPPGWSEGVDPGSGRTYYFNAATMASQWTPP